MGSRGIRRVVIFFAIAAVLLLPPVIYYLLHNTTTLGSPMLEGGMQIPYISQLDYDEVVCVLGGTNRSVKSSGCGATCISMISTYLTGSHAPTPDELFNWAFENGYYTGDGLSHECLTELAERSGLTSEWIPNDEKKILSALNAYHPVIAHVGPGIFTDYGHYIVLRGVDKDGRIYVNDPSSLSRSKKTYALKDIIRESRTANAFMVLYSR